MQKLSFSIAALLVTAIAARANVKPNALFSDHMVIQQDKPVIVWGTADAGEAVTVTLGAAKETVTPGADGKWQVKLAPQKAAGMDAPPSEMTIAGKNTITVKDILIGEVWIGSGQSNMEFTVSKTPPLGKSFAGLTDEAKEIAAANFPKIRMFTVKQVKTHDPQTTLTGTWEICSPQTVPAFSAVGYLFARDLQREIKQPVGIVLSAYGASTADAWISREAFMADPVIKPVLDDFDNAIKTLAANPNTTYAQVRIPTPINKARPAATGRPSNPVNDQHQPTVLFNGMIAPIIPFAMRGVIWYQGESIIGGEAGLMRYGHVQNTVINDWRTPGAKATFPSTSCRSPASKTSAIIPWSASSRPRC